jgi:hypothetical protein
MWPKEKMLLQGENGLREKRISMGIKKNMSSGRRCAPRDGHCFIRLYGFFEWGNHFKEKMGLGEKIVFWGKDGHMGESKKGMGLRKGHSPRKRLGWYKMGRER